MFKKMAVLVIILLAIILRFYNLGEKPLWIDEVLFYTFVTEGANQEFVPCAVSSVLSNFVNIHDEFWLRFPFALAGVLCVVAVFLVKGTNKYSLIVGLLFAIFPIFVFWSQMARPYIFGSLFIILGYRWWPFYFFAIFSTPLSIIGLNITKFKRYWLVYLSIICFAIGLFLIRPDTDRGFNLEFLFNAKRIWVLPITVLLLYLDDLARYFIPKWK